MLMADVTGVDSAGGSCKPPPVRCLTIIWSSPPAPCIPISVTTSGRPVAPGLKRIEDATRIRRSILLAFERAELTHDDAERQRLLTFVIVGGGATGVEMAGAIADIARQTLANDFRRIDPRTSRIILLEAGPRVLPTLPEDSVGLCRAGADADGRRREDLDARDELSSGWCRPRAWPHRRRHHHLGCRGGCFAGGAAGSTPSTIAPGG